MISFSIDVNEILKYQMEIESEKILIIHYIIPSIEKSTLANKGEVFDGLKNHMIDWAKEEILMYGYVSMYHLWEKQIGKIIKLKSNNRVFLSNKDLVKNTKRILKNNFDIDTIDMAIWLEIEKARNIVNAYKHGFGNKFYFLKKKYDDIIINDNDGFQTIIVTEQVLLKLIDALEKFYDQIETSNRTRKK